MMKPFVRIFSGLFLIFVCHSVIFPGTAASQEKRREAIVEAAKKEGKLQIYALLVISDHMQIIQRFKEKYPFIDVQLYRGTSERLYNRIETEARANTYLVDVIGVAGFQMYQLVKRGLVGKYDSPERRHYGAGFKDKESHWTAYYVNPLVTAYNTRQVSAQDAPKDYPDLLGPKWKGKLVMEDDEIEWFSTMMGFWGEEKGAAYMRRLGAQNFYFRKGHTLMTQLVAAGEYPGAVLLYAPQTQSTRSAGAPIDWNPLNPTVTSMNVMGIAARAPHPNAAMLYVDHMLSEEIQREYISGKFFKVSARQGISSAIQQKLNQVKLIPTDISQSEHMERHTKKFAEIFLANR
ncbi:MAG: extracellular solute-binding protein [Deltaproteobacteria bacterium]|nr:extracellular solute-binding protein [Deltaproteobacteria bacterium]